MKDSNAHQTTTADHNPEARTAADLEQRRRAIRDERAAGQVRARRARLDGERRAAQRAAVDRECDVPGDHPGEWRRFLAKCIAEAPHTEAAKLSRRLRIEARRRFIERVRADAAELKCAVE